MGLKQLIEDFEKEPIPIREELRIVRSLIDEARDRMLGLLEYELPLTNIVLERMDQIDHILDKHEDNEDLDRIQEAVDILK